MTPISKNWNTDLNYWEMNPIMRTFKIFNDLYESDKAKKKNKSSKLMWAIALLVDPAQGNPWRNVNPVDRKVLIKDEYLNNPQFNWEDSSVVELVEAYREKCLSPAEKSLIELEDKLAQRARFLAQTEYVFDSYEINDKTGKPILIKGNAEQLDKMLANSEKIYKQLATIKKDLFDESVAAGQVEGGGKESPSDARKW